MSEVRWIGSISDTTTAIRRSGRNEGGGRVMFDVPDCSIDALAALMALTECQLEITVRAVRADTPTAGVGSGA